MATLVLSAAGAAVGGPIGGAIGAMIGQQIDQRLFAPKSRKGPRLGDLAVQTSSYGSELPKIFGTMRVAGTVIWASEIKEEKHKSGGGKGKPKTTTYSYSASFAVALSARAIRGVGRIWADGKLLRGAGGDWKSETGFRLYPGDEEQAPDPLIASHEQAGETPAYRGIAYGVFEDFELGDYGNRIPSLTFEVEADAGEVSIGAIAEALSGGALGDGGTPSVAGYAGGGETVRAALEPLAGLASLSLVDDGAGLLLRGAGAAAVTIDVASQGARAEGEAAGASELTRQGAGAPREVAIGYYDPARDYQTGLQRAFAGTAGNGAETLTVPAALNAGAAKGYAEQRLAALLAGRSAAKLHLAWRWAGLRAGSVVRAEGMAGSWRVSRSTLDRMVATLDLVRVAAEQGPTPAATPGRPAAQPDLVHGPTVLRLFDLPALVEQAAEAPLLAAAAAGREAAWRRAVLSASFDGGASWQAAGATAAGATMGVTIDALAASGAALFDTDGLLEVELLNDSMWLESRSDGALIAGENLALVGDELLQFGRAEPLGGRRFRLSRLLRGRRGTEWAAAAHQPGEEFTLIEEDRLAPLDLSAASLGGEVRLRASGTGDGATGVEVVRLVRGEALRPPAPVHLSIRPLADGTFEVSWVRRSRTGWAWLSGSDTPLGEESEAYRITISGAGFTRTATLSAPSFLYQASDRAADGNGPIQIEVVQIGTRAASRPARLSIG